MRVKAIGVIGMKGKSKGTGNEYDFVQLIVSTEVEQVATANMRKTGFGFECHDIDIKPDLLKKFATVPGWPADLELIIEQAVDRHGIKSVVADFKVVASVTAPHVPFAGAKAA